MNTYKLFFDSLQFLTRHSNHKFKKRPNSKYENEKKRKKKHIKKASPQNANFPRIYKYMLHGIII